MKKRAKTIRLRVVTKPKTKHGVISTVPLPNRVSALEHLTILHSTKISKLENLYILSAQKVDNIADAVRYGNDCNERIVEELRGTRDDIASISTKIDSIGCEKGK